MSGIIITMKRMFSLLQGNRDLPGFLQARRPAGPRIDSSAKNVFDGRVRADSGRIESPRLPAVPRPACYRGFFLHRHHAASVDDADAYSNLSEFAAVHETVHGTTRPCRQSPNIGWFAGDLGQPLHPAPRAQRLPGKAP